VLPDISSSFPSVAIFRKGLVRRAGFWRVFKRFGDFFAGKVSRPAIDDFPDKETIHDRFGLKSSKKG
jgi:hypothetical protein